MDEFLTCPICHQPHRKGARFCTITGRPLTPPQGTPTVYTPTASAPAAVPQHLTPGGGALLWLVPLFNQKRRVLHDYLSDTRVVKS